MFVHIKREFKHLSRKKQIHQASREKKNVTVVHTQFHKPQNHISSISINGAKGSIIEDTIISFDISIYHVDSSST